MVATRRRVFAPAAHHETFGSQRHAVDDRSTTAGLGAIIITEATLGFWVWELNIRWLRGARSSTRLQMPSL
jgi:hypothetical protein